MTQEPEDCPVRRLLRHAAGPRAATALLQQRLGPVAAADLDRDDVAADLDYEAATLLLAEGWETATPEVLAADPWALPVATLCTDAHVLSRLGAAALGGGRSAVGWLARVKVPLATRLAENTEVDTYTRYLLMGLTNPFEQPKSWAPLLEEPPATRTTAAALLDAGRQLNHPSRHLQPILQAPDLGCATAIWLLEQLSSSCREPGTSVACTTLRERSDINDLLGRPEPDAAANDQDPQDHAGADEARRTAAVARLVALATAHAAHSCELARGVWTLLFYRIVDPAFDLPVASIEPLLTLAGGVHALTQRTGLPLEVYRDLARRAVADPEHVGIQALAENPSCPDELLLDAPAAGHESLVARLAVSRFGDRPGPLLTLADLQADGRDHGLSIAALLELAEQITPSHP